MKGVYFLIFVFFCSLDGKQVTLDLEAEFPNRSSISIVYLDNLDFSYADLAGGVIKPSVCEISLFSNLKESLELLLSVQEGQGSQFFMREEKEGHKIPFYLFFTENRQMISNLDILFQEAELTEPLKKTILLGVQVPKVSKKEISSGTFSTNFTVILKNVG